MVKSKAKGKNRNSARSKLALQRAKQRQLAVSREIEQRYVQNPYDELGPPIAVEVNVAEHPADLLRARGVITEPQHAAALRFCHAFEGSGLGGVRAIDMTREHVDGGSAQRGYINLAAFERLREFRKKAGELGYVVLAAVMGRGRTITEVAESYVRIQPAGQRNARGYITCILVEALDAINVDRSAKPPQRVPIRFARDLGVATDLDVLVHKQFETPAET